VKPEYIATLHKILVNFMDEDYFKEQAARVRQIASNADPFTKRRLLDLAQKYDGRKSIRRPAPLPSVTIDHQQHLDNHNGGGDPG
jgi:arginine utilization protein RocB